MSVPPDSFMVYLVAQGATPTRLVNHTLPDPQAESYFFHNNTLAYYYEDSDNRRYYDADKVTISETPNVNGFYTVTLNTAAATQTGDVAAKVVFSLASSDWEPAGMSSFLLLDGAQAGCPEDVFCCDPATGDVAVIDDGLPCTSDDCTDGVVTHEVFECCGGCGNPSADIVIMIDITGSMAASEYEKEKEAVRDFLHRFAYSAVRPRVAIGHFGNENGAVGLAEGLTLDYDLLNQAIDGLLTPQGATNVAEAIRVAQQEIMTHGQCDTPNYIILITDGKTNKPDSIVVEPEDHCMPGDGQEGDDLMIDHGFGWWCDPQSGYCVNPSCDGVCSASCYHKAARIKAECEAQEAMNPGPIEGCTSPIPTQIYVVRFEGKADIDDCHTYKHPDLNAAFPEVEQEYGLYYNPNNPDDTQLINLNHIAAYWLKYNIATDDAHYLDAEEGGEGGLTCSFHQIAELISCDDLDPNTVDSCVLGVCVHEPVAGGS